MGILSFFNRQKQTPPIKPEAKKMALSDEVAVVAGKRKKAESRVLALLREFDQAFDEASPLITTIMSAIPQTQAFVPVELGVKAILDAVEQAATFNPNGIPANIKAAHEALTNSIASAKASS